MALQGDELVVIVDVRAVRVDDRVACVPTLTKLHLALRLAAGPRLVIST